MSAKSDENNIYLRVYLGVKGCEAYLCFVAIVRVRSIMVTSLFSLFYVTSECYRFLHREWANIQFCVSVWNLFRTHPLSRLPTSLSRYDNLQIRLQRLKKQIEWIPHVLELENRTACTTFEPWFGIWELLLSNPRESHARTYPFTKVPRDDVRGVYVYWGGGIR